MLLPGGIILLSETCFQPNWPADSCLPLCLPAGPGREPIHRPAASGRRRHTGTSHAMMTDLRLKPGGHVLMSMGWRRHL